MEPEELELGCDLGTPGLTTLRVIVGITRAL